MSLSIMNRKLRSLFAIALLCTLIFHTLLPVSFALNSNTLLPKVKDPNLSTQLLTTGLDFPSSMIFLGIDDILVAEKNTGMVKRIINGTILDKPILDVPVANKGERGLLGMAINKNKANQTHVFFYFTEAASHKDGDDVTLNQEPLGNRIYRYTLVDNSLIEPKLLLSISASTPSKDTFHYGGNIVIGPDNDLYLAIGNMERTTQAANNKTGTPPDGNSGILRITLEGKHVGKGILGGIYPLNLYYAYGIRNSFGMDFDPVSGNLWDTENGPTYGDEINLVQAGFNSGSRQIYGIFEATEDNFQPKGLEYFNGTGKYSNPEFVWNQTVGPTALKFLESNRLGSQYRHTMFVGDVNNGNLYNFKLDNERKDLLLQKPLADKIADNSDELENTIFGKGFGGIIDIEEPPDGYLYILTIREFLHNNSGSIHKIFPNLQP
jgi:glucose/arabinose dehydrogenase